MAKFSIDINNKYGVDTFQDVKNTYDWIIASLKELNISKKNIDSSFEFKVGGTRCKVENINEFIQHAYCMSDFEFIFLIVFFTFKNNINVSISLYRDSDITISAQDKAVIQNIEKALHQTTIDETDKSTPINITINGGNNAIANNNSTATVISNSKKIKVENINNNNGEAENKKSNLHEILNSIIANIISNLIWYILGVIALAICTYFFAK